MEIERFKRLIREQRPNKMLSPFELVYQSFEELDFIDKNKSFFLENASFIVEEVRKKCWGKFLVEEKRFSDYVFEQLIDKSIVDDVNTIEAIKWFLNEYTEHIYALSLSNTQSRRSRAGNEFEQIIEFILMGAGIPFDTQGSIGTGLFESAHMAKLVDCVSPGASEYLIDKRNTSLISAKTTLRERWQEVGDEMARTAAREMYLATLDDNISENVIQLIGQNNIILVTIKNYKQSYYNSNPSVITFEDMLKELLAKASNWKKESYPQEELTKKLERYENQIEKFQNKEFIIRYYREQLSMLK